MSVNYAHRVLTNLAIPYQPNNNVTSTDPLYEKGLNVMTDIRGIVQPFPGFNSSLETVASTFTALKRIFVWKRSTGTYLAMFCDVAGGVAKVYKYEIGVDTSAVLIFTSASSAVFDFIAMEGEGWVRFGNGVEMKKYNGSTLLPWGCAKPANAPTTVVTAGGLTTYAGGYFWLITGYRTSDGYETSPSALSACSGNQVAKQYAVTWTAADIDSSCDKVRVYRTTDGGAANPEQMALVGSADRTAGTFADNTADGSLNAVVFAPAFYRNDPPPPARGFAAFAGRIYSYSGNTMYYTGREEISNGVQFDCVPGSSNFGLGASDGNYEKFDGAVTAVATRAAGIAVFTARRIWAWDGSSLDTMYPYLLLDRRGTQYQSNVIGLGNSVAWLDTASQVWLDGEEISLPIRPDIANIDHSQASLAIHISGIYHWLILCDGANGVLYVYDLDTKLWYPPRNCSAKYVFSGNTSDSTVDLLIAYQGTKCLKMTPGMNKDNGSAYAGYVVSNLFDMTAQQQPDWRGVLAWIGTEGNQSPTKFSLLIDDDPDSGTFQQLNTVNDPNNRTQGTYLIEKWAMGTPDDAAPSGRRCSVRLDWSDSSTNWKLYSLDICVQPQVGQ